MALPERCYLLACSPRTGSWLLAHALADTRVLGVPEEYFSTQEETYWAHQAGVTPPRKGGSYRDFLDGVLRLGTTANRCFGAKLMWGYVDGLARNLRGLPEYAGLDRAELLRTVFPELRIVHLRRRDKVRAAVSLWRAGVTGVWAVTPGGAPALRRAAVSFDSGGDFHPSLISRIHRGYHDEERAWRELAERMGVPRLTVQYEDLAANREDAVRRVLGFLDDPQARTRPVPPPRLRRQADDKTDRWVEEWTAATGGCPCQSATGAPLK